MFSPTAFAPFSRGPLFSPYRMKARFTREHHKQLASGLAPIYLRLTVGIAGGPSQRVDVATGVSATLKQWPKGAQRLRGTSADAEACNATLDLWLGKAKETYLQHKNEPGLTAKRLKAALLGTATGEARPRLALLALADAFYQNEARPQVRRAPATLAGYRARRRKLAEYLTGELRQPGLEARAVDLPWLRLFERWLSTGRAYTAATARKHINHVQQAIGYGAHEGLLPLNPVAGYAYQERPVPVDPLYLPEPEVQRLAAAVLPSRALQDVADAWLFCCYTGMSYVEYARFAPAEHLHTDGDGQPWIRIDRQKKRWYTTAKVSIPYLPETAALLAKHRLVHLPKLSNAYFNRELKKVSQGLGLSLPLTVGLARHTCSHRLRNIYGFSDEDAAAICGHSVQMMNANYSRKREEGIKLAMTRLGVGAAPAPADLAAQLRAALADPAQAEKVRALLLALGLLPPGAAEQAA